MNFNIFIKIICENIRLAPIINMVSYKELFNIDDTDLIVPSDTLSEAVYDNSKLDYIFQNVNRRNRDEVEDESINIQTQLPKQQKQPISKDMSEVDSKQVSEIRPDSDSRWKLLRVMAGAHQGWVRSCTVDPVTNKWFVTGSSDSTIKIWDLASLNLKATITGHIMGVRSLAVSSRYPYLFSGSEDKTVKCWDLERTNSLLGCQIRNYHGHVGGIYAMALHPELDLLFTGGRDSVIRVWDLRSRTEIMVLSGHRSDITSIASQIGDPQVITSSMDATIRLWDIRKTTTQLALTHHSKSIRLMAMHPQEMTMCSGDTSGNLKEWLLPGGELLNEFGHSGENKIINTLSINPSNNTLFSGYDDGRMEFYDYVSGNLLQSDATTPVTGSTESAIYASTFDMLGLRLITCEGDKSIKIWGEE